MFDTIRRYIALIAHATLIGWALLFVLLTGYGYITGDMWALGEFFFGTVDVFQPQRTNF